MSDDRTLRERLESLDLTKATPEEVEAIKSYLEQDAMGRSFREFVVASDPLFEIYPHCDYIIDKIQALHDGEFDRLMVMMPPRHSKSYLATKLYPAYFLHQNPHLSVILTACTADLARSKFSVELREFMRQDPINLSLGAAKGKDIWRTEQGGHVIAAGAGGTIIGYGGHLIVIDDPVKDRETATSPIMQQKIHDWYRSVTDTRAEPGCKMLLIMQRWHDEDLAGKILETESASWEILRLPAIAEEDDPIGRDVGEPLCPDRFPLEVLERKREAMGAVFFASMYQQSPVPEGGIMFNTENARYFERIDGDTMSLDGRIYEYDDCQQYLTLDMAHSERATADFTVMMHVMVTPDEDLVVNRVWRGKWSATRVESEIKRRIEELPYLRFIVIEHSAASIATIEMVRKLHAVRDPKPMQSKAVRAVPAQVLQERGKLWTPHPDARGEDWMVPFEDELYRFPSTKNDDQVDALSLAVEYMKELTGRGGLTLDAPDDINTEFNYIGRNQERRNSQLFPWMNAGVR